MTRNLKAFGSALVAALALSATIVATAQAQNGIFTAAEYPATITGRQAAQHKFTVETGIFVECLKANFHGTLGAASSTLTITPDYDDCKVTNPISLTAFVEENGCHFLFHAGATQTPSTDYTSTVDLTCPPTQAISIEAGTCEMKVEPQNGIGPITLTNEAGDFMAQPFVSSTIAYNKTKDGFLCPLDGTGKKTDGSYTGKSTVTGEKETSPNAPISVSVSD